MSRIFLTIVQMSITASFVILAVLLLRLCLRRVPKLFSYALWSIVLFRLVCPVAIESSFGIPQGLNSFFSAMQQEQNASGTNSAYIAGTASQGINQPQGADHAGADTTAAERTEQDDISKGAGAMTLQETLGSTPLLLGYYIWLAGMVVLLLYSGVSYFNLTRKLRGAMPAEENVYEVEKIPTPFVLGFFKPHIFLPTGIEGEEREYILAHEKMHIRRLDYIVKLVGFLVLTLHWMNPIVWIAFLCMTKDMEMSCDEAVIRRAGSSIKKEYSASLLHMAMHKSNLSFAPLAFGEGNVEGRIKNVLHYKKAGIGILAVCICVLIGAAVILTTNQQTPKNQMRVSREAEGESVGTGVLQEQKLTDTTESYMVFSVLITEGQEAERNVIAAGAVTEENRNGELHILSQYMQQEECTVALSVADNADSQLVNYTLPDYVMWAGKTLWDSVSRYYEIEANVPYLLMADYIWSETAEEIEAFECENLMKDASTWNLAMEQSAKSGVSMVLIYYVASEKSSAELSEKLDGFSLCTDTNELSLTKEASTKLEQMHRWRTRYIGDNSAVGNMTDYWFFEPGAPLSKEGVELQTSTEPYEATVRFHSDEDAENVLQKNTVYLEQDAALFFALVQNAGKVNVTVNEDKTVSFTREEMVERYGELWENSESLDDFCRLYQLIVTAQESTGNAADGETKEQTAYQARIEQWARSFCDRDGESILAMLSEAAKEQLQEEGLLEIAGGTATFGISSPWPMQPENGFLIQNINTSEQTAEILYYAMTSDPHVSVWQEKISFALEGDVFMITGEELKFLDSISSAEEYMAAYPDGIISGTQMDYATNGIGAALNNNALLSSSTAYRNLFSPETAAVFLLNLSNKQEEVTTAYGYLDDGTNDVFVKITFVLSGQEVTVKMTQPYGLSGIWVPQNM